MVNHSISAALHDTDTRRSAVDSTCTVVQKNPQWFSVRSFDQILAYSHNMSFSVSLREWSVDWNKICPQLFLWRLARTSQKEPSDRWLFRTPTPERSWSLLSPKAPAALWRTRTAVIPGRPEAIAMNYVGVGSQCLLWIDISCNIIDVSVSLFFQSCFCLFDPCGLNLTPQSFVLVAPKMPRLLVLGIGCSKSSWVTNGWPLILEFFDVPSMTLPGLKICIPSSP